MHNSSQTCLHQLFEAAADRSPEAVAVVDGTTEVTYDALERRANQLARYLRRLGVGPEMLVGICARRSAEMVAALLGTLKAGAAYLPLDPSYPRERLAFMLKDTASPVILTEKHLAEELLDGPVLSGLLPLERVCLDTAKSPWTAERSDRPASLASPGSLAYVIYTSGSTGLPKGVAIEHRSAVHLCHWARGTFPVEDLAGMLASTSLNFDLSVFEIFVPLAWGGTVLLADNALALPRLATAGRVTFVNTVPSAMAELVRAGLPPSVNTVGLAGEPLKGTLVKRIYADRRVHAVYNLYGPSEDTTYSTWSFVEPGDPEEPSIGRPLPNTRLHLLDCDQKPVQAGEPGEVYLGGSGLARGYLGRPDLTAERFIPDPFSGRAGERLYRVGDLARARPDGQLQFLGRVDHQVKIRGFRIELGEIEAALCHHSAVTDAVVTAAVLPARESGEEERHLVAYVEACASSVEVSALRAFLLDRLPVYMVPSLFLLLEALPRTPNGKVSRQALPDPAAAVSTSEAKEAAPRGELEELLAGLWSEALAVAKVGLHDSFLELGGHSLSASRMAARVRDVTGVELDVSTLFAHPTAASLAEALREARNGSLPADLPQLVPVPRGEALPASPGQARLWFLEQLQPGLATYNMALACHLAGPIRPAALQEGLQEIVRRHESLRTTFDEIGGVPVQKISKRLELLLPVIDLESLPADRRELEVERLSTARAATFFDLRSGPLIRTDLLRLGVEEHRLLLVCHHIVSDDWSVWVLFRELAAIYLSLAAGGPVSELTPLPIQYADFADWQNRLFADQILRSGASAHVRRLLENVSLVLPLPTDRPRPPAQTFRGRLYPFTLPMELAPALERLARREGATLFMALLAVFQALLWRLTGEPRFLVGSPTAGRNRTELEGLIGFLTNTALWRAELDGNPDFRTLMRRVRENVLRESRLEATPFELIPAELQTGRDPSYNPFFQVIFALQTVPRPAAELAPGLRMRSWELDTRTAKVDLSLFLWNHEGLTGAVEFNTALFDLVTIFRLKGQYHCLLEEALAAPHRPVAELSLLGAAERQQILEEWNDTATVVRSGVRIHQLFEEQVARTPGSVAVVCGAESWTYAELDLQAGRLARRLRAAGAGPGTLVAVFLERSPYLITAVLGVLKAGAAYIPLEAAWPQSRLRWILGELAVPILVTQSSRRERVAELLPEIPALTALVFVDEMAAGDRMVADFSSTLAADDGDLAYIIFTSGSTGTPKGVMVRHQPVVNLITWVNRTFCVEPADRILFVTALSFDLSVYDIFGLLAAGGSIHVATETELRDPDRLVALLCDEPVTFWDSAPAALQQLVPFFPAPRSTPGSRLRLVLLSGDWIPLPLPGRVRSSFPGVQVASLGGATEATIWSNWFPVGEVDSAWPSIPYGRPIQNARYMVLDAAFQPCPPGVAGDLYIGGHCLSVGYIGDPVLTAARYLPDPFSSQPGARLYRTGDRTRFMRDGNLEFLGRLDRQVKVRGFRIELGEIESALAEHPGVRVAVALVRPDHHGERHLLAWVVPENGVAPAAAELRTHLRERLPEYMIPSAFVSLASLPVTANGKLDLRALPLPFAEVAVDPAAEKNAWWGELEELIAGAWERVLGIEHAGLHQNFFTLGGHSLLATQVIASLRDLLKVNVPVRLLFEHPTVAGLSRSLREAQRSARLPVLEARQRGARPPLSFAQQRLWFLERLQPGTSQLNLPDLRSLRGRLRVPVLEQALAEIVRRHEVLRTVVALDGEPYQLILPAVAPPLPYVDLSALPSERRHAEAERLLEIEGRRTFDLERGPLVRFLLVRFSHEDHHFLATFHHWVADGGSLLLFESELALLYRAFSAGCPAPLAEPPVQYADYAAWQRRCLAGDHLAEQLSYWRRRLEVPVPPVRLPADRPAPARAGVRGGQRQLVFPPQLTAAVRSFARREGGTIYMTLLAAFLTLLHRATGRRSLTLGVPVSLRETSQIESLIGLFVNTLVLRAELKEVEDSFRALLAQTRERTLEALAHADLPFEQLVEELKPERTVDETPFFQIMCSFQTLSEGTVQAGDLELRRMELTNGTAQFELTLYMIDTGRDLAALAEYRSDSYDAATIDRLLGAYQAVVEGAMGDPGRRLVDIPLAGWPSAALASVPRLRSSGQQPAETVAARRARLDALRAQLTEAQAGRLRKRLGHIRSPRTTAPLLIPIVRKGSRIPFFCVHAIGGDVLGFGALAEELAGRPFWAFQARGLATDEEPLESIQELAASYVEALRCVQPQGPYLLGGWSMGGAVAFEMACQLLDMGTTVGLVALFDSAPPQPRRSKMPPANESWYLAEIARYLAAVRGREAGISEADLDELPPEERIGRVLERLQWATGIPRGAGLPDFRRLLRVFKANFRAALTWAPEPAPVTLAVFRPRESIIANQAAWATWTTGDCEVLEVPGDHFSLLSGDNVQVLGARLEERLTAASCAIFSAPIHLLQ